jgi:hypothetical protein
MYLNLALSAFVVPVILALGATSPELRTQHFLLQMEEKRPIVQFLVIWVSFLLH